VPSGAGTTQIVPWPPASWGPKLQVINMRDRGRGLDVPDGRQDHVSVPTEPEGGR
jgi:hypothetical protein